MFEQEYESFILLNDELANNDAFYDKDDIDTDDESVDNPEEDVVVEGGGDGEVTDDDELMASLDPVVDNSKKTFTKRVLDHWAKRRAKYTHDYARVGRLLSPNPEIMAAAKKDSTLDDEEACERLVFKLLVPNNLVGDELVRAKADMIQKFRDELMDFQNHTGIFKKPWIWELAKVMMKVGFFFFL